MPQSFMKDPQAVLDYKFYWTNWLESSESISSHAITPDAGITVDSSSITDSNKTVTVWISGGTVNSSYNVTCHIVTSQGREDDRTIRIGMVEK